MIRQVTLTFAALLVATINATNVMAGDHDTMTRCGHGPFSGGYVGGHVGYVSVDADQTVAGTDIRASSRDPGWMIGGHGGYNWQCDRVLYGLEADASWIDADSKSTYSTATFDTSYGFVGTLRGRLGLVHDDILFYATGGLAVASVEHTLADSLFSFRQSDRDTRWGWTVGGGVELNREQWRIRAEVLYVDLSDTTTEYTAACDQCRTKITWDDDFVVARIGFSVPLHRERPRHEPLK